MANVLGVSGTVQTTNTRSRPNRRYRIWRGRRSSFTQVGPIGTETFDGRQLQWGLGVALADVAAPPPRREWPCRSGPVEVPQTAGTRACAIETRLNEQAGSGGHDVVEVSPTFRIQGTLDGGLKIDRHIYIPYPLFYEYWRAPWND